MYVLIQYVLERKREVVEHKDARGFFPQDVDDYERETFYEVFWSGKSETWGGYYEATIIQMTSQCNYP